MQTAIINDGNIIVDPAALKHDTQFHDGTRKPTEADIRRVFQINAKLSVPKREPNGTWKWEDVAMDNHAKPTPRLRKNNNMCFSVVGTQYRVFHYHKGFYDDEAKPRR